MRRIAIFVEGQTEQIFLSKLVKELLGQKNVTVVEQSCGTKVALTNDALKFFVLVYDCRGDVAVKSQILKHRRSLLESGYQHIIGLRDVYPQKISDIPQLKQHLGYMLPQADLPAQIFLAIMEVESWFIQEHTHFKSNTGIEYRTEDFIRIIGLNPAEVSTETINHPYDSLVALYNHAAQAHDKSKATSEKLSKSLDYSKLCYEDTKMNGSLNDFVDALCAALGI